MAYKKFITRNGKVYGPYIYHSKRVNGRVVSEYKGQHLGSKKNLNNKFIFVFFSVFVLLLAVFLFQNTRLTGRSVVNFNVERVGDSLVGDLEFVMYGGELIPANSEVVIENMDRSYVFLLSDILGGETFEGDYFLEGIDLNGSGEGYGLVGEKFVSGSVYFDLELFEIVEKEFENGTIEEEVSSEIVSLEIPFGEELDYSIVGYSDYSILNVRSDFESLEVSDLNVEEKDGILYFSTEYSYLEEGYGEEYLSDFEKTYSVDVSSLGVDLVPGSLIFSMSFEGVEIARYETIIEEDLALENETIDLINESLENETLELENESIDMDFDDNMTLEENVTFDDNMTLEENITLEDNLILEENVTEIIVQESVFDNLILSDYERSFLNNFFGSVPVVSEAVSYRERVIVTFSLGEYSVSNSYDERLSDSEIMRVIQRDRILWLQDLVRELNYSKENYSDLNDLNEFYSI